MKKEEKLKTVYLKMPAVGSGTQDDPLKYKYDVKTDYQHYYINEGYAIVKAYLSDKELKDLLAKGDVEQVDGEE